ncbi:hypothetical protein J1N35_034975 [Gossypium stocksii]|uniref:Uncharacterized protein n=1 Tax=Gossypium stocksii TaxID=47602 RepID=A0A9D3UT28_9ROSI|nr:hypothetical protein J1N35_034975 [Gossypium stocksii]
MKEHESINGYHNRLSMLVKQMKSYGDMFDDLKVVDKILIRFAEKFDPIMVVTEETKDLSTMIIQRLMGSLRSYKKGFYVAKKNPLKVGFNLSFTILPWIPRMVRNLQCKIKMSFLKVVKLERRKRQRKKFTWMR